MEYFKSLSLLFWSVHFGEKNLHNLRIKQNPSFESLKFEKIEKR